MTKTESISFDYVVPPLEGFWRQEGVCGIDYSRKEDFKFISVVRHPIRRR